MSGDSYTLREVAELLGVSKRTLQRRMKEGAFPRRFLAPGRHGLETRIPADDVARALEDLRGGGVGFAAPLPVPAEVTDSLLPVAREVGVAAADPGALRAIVAEVLREERTEFLEVVRTAVALQHSALLDLNTKLAEIHVALERLRASLAGGPAGAPAPRRVEVEHVLQEIDEIERMLALVQQ